jgi:hypothetical protein
MSCILYLHYFVPVLPSISVTGPPTHYSNQYWLSPEHCALLQQPGVPAVATVPSPLPPPVYFTFPCTHTLYAFSLKCDCDVVVQMAERANWSILDTALFLDLVLEANNLCHWSQRVPTSSEWTQILTKFKEVSDQKLSRRQLSNKWHELRTAYFKWRNSVVKKYGLGRDPQTGDVTYDPVLVAALSHEVLHSTFVIVLLQ